MGKTPTNLRLTIWVDGRWRDQDQILELSDKGHTIIPMDVEFPPVPEPDLILSPVAHCWTDEMFDTGLLDVALKRARARKKESKK
jgi:hypothetical protein